MRQGDSYPEFSRASTISIFMVIFVFNLDPKTGQNLSNMKSHFETRTGSTQLCLCLFSTLILQLNNLVPDLEQKLSAQLTSDEEAISFKATKFHLGTQ